MGVEVSPGAVVPSKPPVLWLGVGGLALVSLAAAAAVVMRSGAPEPQMVPLNAAKPVLNAAVEKAPADKGAADRSATARVLEPAGAATEPARVAKPASKAAKPAPEPIRVAAACSYCGVVESVDAVQRKGQGTGVGVVAGGVLGAAVGNQVGHGNGRAAMTVLGAVGGGLAGNEVEKRARAETVYQVRIKFDDGTVRTIEQATAPKVGARVEMQGSKLKAVS
jgi:outer membrane lipoprotein SlyB